MKKFLSLVLALVMTMSLVTIGAGAAEYKDLTDKSEIQYEEAVAVLNKIGIITGYEDGSFKPTGALTRGAAAKIIVSLMIGPEAASNLTVTAAPYSDVPVTNTFAGVISYCKTAGYINGYADGTFRPTAPLTGYAFTKMLLGALGYSGKIEGFTGSGWTMNVAKLGNKAGLFNDFATAFKGNDGINREQACLLALNTLKATEVEYAGSDVTVKGDNIDVTVGNTQYSYVTSNNTKINKNIKVGDNAGLGNNYYTLEFGEEHFQDLKLVQNTVHDDYGRPANQWNFKNVKIGVYAKTADYDYIKAASGDTNEDKVKDMGLNDYKFNSDTLIKVNGKQIAVPATGKTTLDANAKLLAGVVKNGNHVEVYLDDDTANLITSVVVTETQVMQVNHVTSKDVTLKTVEKTGLDAAENAYGTKGGVSVEAVKSDDECYNTLKGLKADDFVVVTPLTTNNGSSYSVDAVYVPTTVSGNITKVKVNSKDNNTSAVTVGGTDYKVSFNWTAEDADGDRMGALNGNSVTTSQESTVYLDSYGFAIYVANVKATTSYFLYDETYANVIDGRIHYFAQGWDSKGNAVSLDFGTTAPTLTSNTVYAYKTAASNSNADYQLDTAKQSTNVKSVTLTGNGTTGAAITADDTTEFTAAKTNVKIGTTTYYYKSDVKYIFVTPDNGTTPANVDTITVKNGAQKVTFKSGGSNNISVVLNDNNEVTAIFIHADRDVEVSQNIMYVQKQTAVQKDASGKDVSVFTAYINGEKKTDLVANKKVTDNTFYTYSENNGIYTVNAYTQASGKATSVLTNVPLLKANIKNDAYVTVNGKALNLHNATVIDLTDGGTISSASDMTDTTAPTSYTVSLVFNDSTNSSSLGRVAYVFITSYTGSATYTATAQGSGVKFFSDKDCTTAAATAKAGSTVYVQAANAQKALTSPTLKLTQVTAPTDTVKAVYSFTMPENDLADDITEVAVVKVTLTDDTKNANGVTVTLKGLEGGVAYVAEGDIIDVVVEINAPAGTATATTATISSTGDTFSKPKTDAAAADIAGIDTVTGGNNATIKTTADSTPIDNVTYTFRMVVGSADTTVALTVA